MVCCFKLTVQMVRSGIQEFIGYLDGPIFLKRKLVGYGVDRFQ